MRQKITRKFDSKISKKIKKFALPLLRVSLGVAYFWFGLLKVFNVSPLTPMIETSYFFLPFPITLILLGIWESLIGLGLIFKRFIRTTIFSLWCQMVGVIGCSILSPSIFFKSNPLILTLEGEFMVKNIILLAASIVVVSYKSETSEKF